MKMKDIAKSGLKGRKKDTFLIKIVVILAFIFIVTSTIYQSSIEKTKAEQQFDLYGQWHAAYLGGNEDILEKLKKEPEVDDIGISLIVGEYSNCGAVGTFNQELLDMGRFSLYKGRYPEKADEIMLELNQMSNMNLDLEVGQKVNVNIEITTIDKDVGPYIMKLNKEYYEKGLYPDYLQHHETPFENIGDIVVVVSNDYFFYYPFQDQDISPEQIREKGCLHNQKVILKKEFTVTGILESYTDKWDLDGHVAANAFITEEAGNMFKDALYKTTIEDFSDYEFDYNIFLQSNSLQENLYSQLASDYPNRVKDEEERVEGINYWFWMSLYGATDEEVEKALEASEKWIAERKPEEWEDKSLEGSDIIGTKMEVDTSNFRKNTFSYPDTKGTTEYVLALTVIAIIFIATALAIFQIFLTQMKRRSRKIVLLKSIGATKSQIVEMLLYEGLYFLRSGLFIGIPVGFGASALIIFFMNKFGGRNLRFYISPQLFILGIISGILALFIGMVIPTIYAVNIPLVGTMEKPPKHNKIKKKKDRNVKRQTFSYINKRYFKLNKGKALISFGISLIAIIILLSTIFLSFSSFDNYKETVVANNRPDYAMEAIFGEREKMIPVMEKELKAIDGVKSTETYKIGKQLLIWYDGIENNELLNAFENLLPNRLLISHFSKYNKKIEEEPEHISNAFYTKIYAINGKGSQFDKYNSLLTEGNLDREKFISGDEIILLVPMYFPGNKNIATDSFSEKQVITSTNEDNRMKWLFKNSGIYDITYDIRYKDHYIKQNYIKPGDTVYISANKEAIMDAGGQIIEEFFYISKEVKVGGIIHYLPKEGLWPFSYSVPPYVVISSIDGMEYLYPKSKFGLGKLDNIEHLEDMINLIYPYSYGRTVFHIYTNSKQKDVLLDAELLSYANEKGYTIYNYKNSNSELYYEALNNTIIITLLGITAAAIALIILYNTTVSKMEQDRNRIGILQALGVSREEFSHHYLKTGILVGILTLIIAHVILILVLYFTSAGTMGQFSLTFTEYMKDIFAYRLWLYPWPLHITVCIIYFILSVLVNYLPSRSITNKYPVDNIRSLAR